MKAIVQHEYGAPQDVLRLVEVEMSAVGAEDVLVSVRASSANPWDWHFIRGEPVLLRPAGLGGVRKPKFPVPGGDLAGTVEQAGTGVTAFRPGDEVYGFGHGAFAEYIAVPQGSLAPKPGNLTFEQAAAVPLAAVTALQCLRAGGIEPGQQVLAEEVGDLIESGRITPVIDRTYPLTEAAAAVGLVEEGSPGGKVIVVDEPPTPQLPPH
jgi:NADPH:quinone reductase-like Zn-dependent oxidoreductase